MLGKAKRFSGVLYKTDSFLKAHPFGTVPAAFSPDGHIGIFRSNSILRAVARVVKSLIYMAKMNIKLQELIVSLMRI